MPWYIVNMKQPETKMIVEEREADPSTPAMPIPHPVQLYAIRPNARIFILYAPPFPRRPIICRNRYARRSYRRCTSCACSPAEPLLSYLRDIIFITVLYSQLFEVLSWGGGVFTPPQPKVDPDR